MRRTVSIGRCAGVCVTALVVFLSAASLIAQSDRGTITGTVTDPSGAVIVGATVTATNKDTGVATKTTTSSSGIYTIPFLRSGNYEVSSEQSGFKRFVESGLVLQVGATIRADVTMQLGGTQETVNVTSQVELIERETSGRGNVITGREVQELPIVSQGEARNPGFYMTLVPGVTGKGTATPGPSGAGRQLNTTVNGSPSGSTEFHLDGAVIGQGSALAGDFRILTFPPDVIAEYNVMTLNPPAEFGQTGLGITAFSLKSGTNQWHVTAYDYIRNCSSDALNPKREMFCMDARGFFAQRPAINKQHEFGVLGGGPIVKDKLFVFGWYSGFRLNRESGGNALDTLPTAAMKAGDLSPYLLGGQVLGQDALGRDVYLGAIYDPASTRNVTAGVVDPVTGLMSTGTTLIRDAFGATLANNWAPTNIIPSNRIDPVAAAMFGQFADPPACSNCLGGFQSNWLTTSSNQLPSNQWGTKVDYNLGDNHRFMGEFIWWRQRPVTGSKWPGAISEGSIQTNDQNIARFAHDWIIRPNIVNHYVFGFTRNFTDTFPAGGLDWPAALGYSGVPPTGPGSTFPELIIGGLGNVYGRGSQGYGAFNNFTFNDTLTWTRGRHTIKTGFSYYQFHVNALSTLFQSSGLTFNSGTTSLPGPFFSDNNGLGGTFTGMGVGGFLLGQVSQGRAGIVVSPVEDRSGRYAGFVQDDFKVTSKLTLNLGLRYDLMLPVVNKKNQVSWWDPTIINPDLGIPGVLEYGSANRRNGAVTDMRAIGPRFGLAYSLSDKTVIRAGYGILYTAGSAMRSIGNSFNQVGFNASNTVVANQAGGVTGLFPGTVPGNQNFQFILQNGWPSNLFQAPPFIDPNFANGQGPMSFGAFPGGGENPDIQNWSFNIQREMKGGVLLDVAYVGTKGTHLSSRLMNTNVLPTYYITDPSLQYQGQFNCDGTMVGSPGQLNHHMFSNIACSGIQALPVVQSMPISMGVDINGNPAPMHVPFPGFQALWGGGAVLGQALRPFPQYGTDSIQQNGQMEDNAEQVGVSIYHALQVQARKRFGHGLTFLTSYTWSKTLTDAESLFSEFSGFTQDFYNRRPERALSINDYAHNLVVSYQYELPFGKGKKFVNGGGVSDKVLGGWLLAGVQQYQSGAPEMIAAGSNPFGNFAGAKGFLNRPNVVPGVEKRSPVYLNGTWDPNGVGDAGTIFNFNAWQNPSASDATRWTHGNAPRTDGAVRRFPYYNEDFSIIKRTSITERVTIEFRADFLNMFNRTLFGFDQGGDQYGSLIGGNVQGFGQGSFGHVTAQANYPREIQFGLKISY